MVFIKNFNKFIFSSSFIDYFKRTKFLLDIKSFSSLVSDVMLLFIELPYFFIL